MAARSSTRSRTRTATVVRFNSMERELPIFGPVADELRQDWIDQTTVLSERFQNLWQTIDLDGIEERGSMPSPEEREKIAGALYIVGEMRNALSELLYFTESVTKPQKQQQHQQDPQHQQSHEFAGGSGGGGGSEENPYR